MNDTRIAFIGAGNMAGAIIGGLLAQGVPARQLSASNRNPAKREALAREHGIRVEASNSAVLADADVVVLGVKPQVMGEVCQELAPHLRLDQLIVSVAAGITCASLTRWLGQRALVRCMPNVPSQLRLGASGLFANDQVSAEQRARAQEILAAVGLALWVEEERQLDAVTAVSGSGPAYFFLLMEAMTQAGTKLGLPAEVAQQLTLHTARGAAAMACQGDRSPEQLRRSVMSPKGTTERAIETFQAGAFEDLVEEALTAAADRAAELAQLPDR